MTPEERNLVSELFDRLAALENAERDPEAERTIKEGLQRAPNAVYALVQTALVQDEALKRADTRIRDLEAQLGNQAEPPRSSSFLGGMREALTGRRGSVPSVRPAEGPMGAPPNSPPEYQASPMPMATGPGFGRPGGGSFLGTAAAAAAGVIGGSLMLDSIRGMMGHRQGLGGFGAMPGAAVASESKSPWTDPGAGGGNLAREAGVGDIGGGQGQADANQGQAALDSDQQAADDTQASDDGDYQDGDYQNGDYEDDADFDGDDGDFDGGGDFGDDNA
ncbi:MAG TPA: DUF2076 domain-containing protein [Xanthobacteraceae bacterium]|jgi:hypothetical protein